MFHCDQLKVGGCFTVTSSRLVGVLLRSVQCWWVFHYGQFSAGVLHCGQFNAGGCFTVTS